jgi:hypothetical protein
MDIMSREAIVKQGLEPSEVEWRKAGKKQYAEVILKIPLTRTRGCWCSSAQATERWDGRKGVPRPSQASPGPVKRRLAVWIPQARLP